MPMLAGAIARSDGTAEVRGAPAALSAGSIGAVVQTTAESTSKRADGAGQPAPPAAATHDDAGHVSALASAPQPQTGDERSAGSRYDGQAATSSTSLRASSESASIPGPASAQMEVRAPAAAISEQVTHPCNRSRPAPPNQLQILHTLLRGEPVHSRHHFRDIPTLLRCGDRFATDSCCSRAAAVQQRLDCGVLCQMRRVPRRSTLGCQRSAGRR